jgi:hypothetical protein
MFPTFLSINFTSRLGRASCGFKCPAGHRCFFGARPPASERAGYCHQSLRDRPSREPCVSYHLTFGSTECWQDNRPGPGGPLTIARRFQRRVDAHTRRRVPEGCLNLCRNLSPHILRVVFDVVLLQKRHELFLETPLSVMLGLRLDVGDRMGLL